MIKRKRWLTLFQNHMLDGLEFDISAVDYVKAYAKQAYKSHLSPGEAAGQLLGLVDTAAAIQEFVSIPGYKDLDILPLLEAIYDSLSYHLRVKGPPHDES